MGCTGRHPGYCGKRRPRSARPPPHLESCLAARLLLGDVKVDRWNALFDSSLETSFNMKPVSALAWWIEI
jgi:hypothetical protein